MEETLRVVTIDNCTIRVFQSFADDLKKISIDERMNEDAVLENIAYKVKYLRLYSSPDPSTRGMYASGIYFLLIMEPVMKVGDLFIRNNHIRNINGVLVMQISYTTYD
jgi:hypothetical protein